MFHIGKQRKNLNSKNFFFEIDAKKESETIKDLTILNYITVNKESGNYSAKTSITTLVPENFEYDLSMIKKYDENLNNSLSFISDFDLEKDENIDKENNSFSSSHIEDSSIEEIEIKTKSHKIIAETGNIEDKEFDFELEKNLNDIKHILLKQDLSN